MVASKDETMFGRNFLRNTAASTLSSTHDVTDRRKNSGRTSGGVRLEEDEEDEADEEGEEGEVWEGRDAPLYFPCIWFMR